MNVKPQIPVFEIFGEDEVFPDIMHCESFLRRAVLHEWTIEPHRHTSLSQIIVVLQGSAELKIDEHPRVLKNEQYLFVPKQTVHGFAFEPGTNGLVLSFAPSVLKTTEPNSAKINAQLSSWFIGNLNRDLRFLINRFSKLGKQEGPFVKTERLGLAHAILANLAGTAASKEVEPTRHSRLLEFEKLIAERLPEGWTACDYAAALSITTGHLCRICRDEMGISATDFIRSKMIDEACRLLAFTNLRINQIGYQMGFNEPTYFTNRFRKAKGETPSQYRRRFN